MKSVAQPQSVAGKKVLPKISDKDVRDAADALGRNSKRAYPDIMDGTASSLDDGIDDEGEVASSTSVPVPSPSTDVLQMINAAIEAITELEGQRALINAKISAKIEELETKGINRHAFRYAKKVAEMSDSQREGLDLSYLLVRQAVNLPMQKDWLQSDEITH